MRPREPRFLRNGSGSSTHRIWFSARTSPVSPPDGKMERMASSLREPAGIRIALGSGDVLRTRFVSPVTAFHGVLALLASTMLACHDGPSDDPASCNEWPVKMGVASSLREIALELRDELLHRDPPIIVETIFGSSSVHARQIRLGAPLDLLISADAEIVGELLEGGRLEPDSVVELARGRLSLVARRDWPASTTAVSHQESDDAESALEALRSPHLERVAIPPPSVPLGRYTHAWLESMDLLEDLEGRIVVTEHARATLSVVDAGHADLAIVYESDARLAKRAVLLARIDPGEHPPIRYVGARVTNAADCASIDEALAAWSAPHTLERFAALGFLAPQPAGGIPNDRSGTVP